MFGEENATEGPTPRRRRTATAETEPRYVKGDRVFVRGTRALRVPGVVVGHYVDWNLYRIVYMVDLAGQSPKAVEEWRLSPRSEGER